MRVEKRNFEEFMFNRLIRCERFMFVGILVFFFRFLARRNETNCFLTTTGFVEIDSSLYLYGNAGEFGGAFLRKERKKFVFVRIFLCDSAKEAGDFRVAQRRKNFARSRESGRSPLLL